MPKQVKKKAAHTKASGGTYLSQISSAVEERAMAGVLYGPPGVGKTTWGAQWPGALFLIDAQEQGIHDLKAARLLDKSLPVLPEADDWEGLLAMLTELASSDHEYDTLVIDSLTGMERLCYRHVCETEFNNDWSPKGFFSYMQGFEVSSRRYWPTFLEHLDMVRANNVNVLLLAHSEIRRHDDPEREGYDRYEPSVHRKIWSSTHRWAEFVLFANFHVDLEGKGTKKKAKGGHDRFLHTENSAAYIAKNRLGLPAVISMGNSGAEAFKLFNNELPNPL